VSAPVLILGVRRSGTTLLRVMLDGHSQLAIPDESYFLPQIADRHGDPIDPDAFADDLARLPTLREWEVDASEVRTRLRLGMTVGEAVSQVYLAYAERQRKSRWGDKTPMYMQHLPMLERLFPDAGYVHLIRDGRDAALSFLAMPEGVVTRTWAHPASAADFACQWRSEVKAARALGRRVGRRYLEVRYERLAAEPEATLRSICSHVELPFEAGMLDYAGRVDVSAKPHQQRLRQPPTTGVRDWRTQMSADDVEGFEHVAGDLLAELGYERTASPTLAGRARLLSYRLRIGAWKRAAWATRRSPLWRRRHPRL
jgi:hypothetical protein